MGLNGINMHAQLSCRARDITFSLCLTLHLLFVCGSSEGSGENVRWRRLILSFTARICD